MLRKIRPILFAATLGLAAAGCHNNDQRATATPAHHGDTAVLAAADMGAGDVKDAVAVLHGTKGHEKVHAVVHFTDTGSGVKVSAHITGLEPNSEHAFHIHEFGDCTDMEKAMSAGGHFNPEKHQHGKPGDPNAHPGDMGNVKADATGMAMAEVTLPAASLTGKNAILGRGVILHEKADDFSQPVGNAGGRIACGVIGVAQVKK
jgi:Cu-Zn family superoxide dismutase